MKTSHKLFFAIPFDTATKNLYDRVCRTIRKRYPSVTTVIGKQEVGPSPRYSDIASFKAQNRELTKQFVDQIRESDIVIADLTHNNPNVHVELGIALIENKNILRVTGRSVTELGFDIRNLEVRQYEDQTQLIKTITSYLDTFFKIKKLPINNQIAQLYFKEPNPIQLQANKIQDDIDIKSTCPPNFIMRDGAVKVEFEILSAKTPNDWFGIYFRAGDNPFIGSHLVYVRQNGMIEIAVYPGIHILATLNLGQSISGRQMLTVQFENDYLEVQMVGSAPLITDKLSHQTVGRVLPAAWCADVKLHSFEMICRDTIEF
jgi:hypothetical protein